MDTLADKPAGSLIDVTLSWPAPSVGRVRLSIEAASLAFWLCGWAVSWVLMAGQLANGGPHPAHPRVPPLLDFWFLVVWLSMWTMFGGVVLWALGQYFRPARPESVRLEAEVLRHDPGGRRRSFTFSHQADPKPTRVARSDIRGFVLEQVGERQRLWLDRGTDRLEIGAELREPEREWLFAVLQKWHAPNKALHLTPPSESPQMIWRVGGTGVPPVLEAKTGGTPVPPAHSTVADH